MGVPSGSERHIVELVARPQLPQRAGQAATTAVRVEGHPVMLEKESPRSSRLHAHPPEIVVSKPLIGVLFDRIEKALDPRRRRSRRRGGAATQARSIAGKERIPDAGKEL